MENDVLISVAMTCYNQAIYIKDAIKSVVSQTNVNWELVIVDDCSTDNSLKVIKKCIKEYNIKHRVKVICNEKNVGYGYSLNKAISHTTGELVAIVDSDDALSGEKSLSISMAAHISHPEVSMTYSDYTICNERLKTKRIFKTKQIDNFLKNGGRISHLKVFKKRFYDMTDGVDKELKQAVDKDLVLKMEEVGKLLYINKNLYKYRHHKHNLSRSIGRKSVEYKNLVSAGRKRIYNNAKERRANAKIGIKIFVDGSKRSAVSRMFPMWNKRGCKVVDDPSLADVQLSVVKIGNRTNLPTVLRIDGIYYDKAENYTARNIAINESHKSADAVVYQSKMAKKMCEKYLDARSTELYSVIYNGVDQADWGGGVDHGNINIVSCAKWRRFKRLPEIIEVFNKFLKKRSDAVLHIIGPMGKGARKIESPNVIYYDRLDDAGIKKVYKKADVYLHMAKKDSCPSTVVEAIAAGIPVITTDACGGATELCNLTKGCVVIPGDPSSTDPDYIYQDAYNAVSREVRDAIVRAMLKVVGDGRRVALPKKLSILYVADQYLAIMRSVIAGRK